MTSEQWQAIKSLTQAALERSTAERELFLADSCAGDVTLRQGVEALVTWHEHLTTAEQQTRGYTTKLIAPEPLTPERWQRLKQIYQAATELASDKRAAYLAQACAGDDALLREAQSLLAYQTATGGLAQVSTDDLLPTPVRQIAAAPAPDGAAKLGYVPGAILAGRYRIVGPLGRGGMGQVYRADDLKLGQPVALKFLSERFARDAAMLAQFHNEVRTARQVSHPNVCRVHDIGEVDGQHFISMEYVDGEDLASLLRRIGRLPSDKAVEIAQQICAGLAAAHGNGVLHRDLKPANVMIDGRGKARLTDFGIAAVAEELRGEEALAGTPAYMAPEQFGSRVATVKSDLYALGLVLYELFTGKRAFEATSLTQYISLHQQHTPTNPSSWIKDIDPLVERAILRCLEKEPERRPASARQVAAALPGGDPLQAALLAGETPSPEIVAAAAQQGSLRPAVAAICLAAVLLGLLSLMLVSGKTMVQRLTPLEKPPEALADRARTLVRQFGYHALPLDSGHGFRENWNYLNFLQEQDRSPTRWHKLATGQPAALTFWYRQSPSYLEPTTAYAVSPTDPPPLLEGMLSLVLDTRGRLVQFQAVPPQVEERQGDGEVGRVAQPVDWATLFNEAGLDLSKFKPVPSRWIPPSYSDSRAAWEGVFPDQPQFPLRVEAAGLRGQPVYFELIGPWSRPARSVAQPPNRRTQVAYILVFSLFVLLMLAGVWLAWRNWKIGRSDHRGAARLGLVVFTAELLRWLFGASHVPTLIGELWLFTNAVGWALVEAGVLWLAYLALEPYARRRWPERIISWSRLLAGTWRDPMVGRDILIGALLGVWIVAGFYQVELLERWMGVPPELKRPDLKTLLGWPSSISVLSGAALASIPLIFGVFMIQLLITLLLRKEKLAVVVAWLSYFVLFTLPVMEARLMVLYVALCTAAFLFVLTRFGLLAAVAGQFFLIFTDITPFTTDLSAWYADSMIFTLLVVGACAVYGFYFSLGGQKVFQGKLLDD
jgi:hypothetical protein